jgi:hypothetical protein
VSAAEVHGPQALHSARFGRPGNPAEPRFCIACSGLPRLPPTLLREYIMHPLNARRRIAASFDGSVATTLVCEHVRRHAQCQGKPLVCVRGKGVRIFLLIAVLLGVAAYLMLVRRKRTKRREAQVRAARARARKPAVPFVSASLRGVTTQEPPRGSAHASGTSDRAA